MQALNSTEGEKLLLVETGCYVHDNRYRLVKSALKAGCDYVFFFDSDMLFGPDTVNQLLANRKDICGVKYHQRGLPLVSTVKIGNADGTLVSSEEAVFPKETFACAGVGTGCLLIHRRVFDKTPQPWFFFEHYPDGSLKTGEDIWFLNVARRAGFPTYCDPRIEVGHIGDITY